MARLTWACRGPLLLLAAAAAVPKPQPTNAEAGSASIRKSLLDLATQRINVWYADDSNLDAPKSRDGVTFRLSKSDKACGGDGVPLTFLEFDINGVRPIDVFNALADVEKQPTWDSHCGKMTPLGDVQEAQARGWAGLFTAPPLASREAYEWQVASANFSAEEFWVVFSTVENDDIRQRKAPEPGSVQMQNCLGAYRITKNAQGGTHVVNTQQVNSHPWPVAARDIANMAWGDSVNFAIALRGVAQKQATLGWNETQTVLPSWMLEDRGCAAPRATTDLRDSLLARAVAEFASDPGKEKTHRKLPNGEMLYIRQRMGECGGSGVAPAVLPVWRGEFRVPDAKPSEVFNVLVAKGREASWNKQMGHVNLTGFKGGTRGVHESFTPPRVLEHEWSPRELWELQAVNHSITDGSYLVAFTSAAEPTTPAFGDRDTTAVQCLAAYEVTAAPEGGSNVRMTSHLNPNIGFLSRLSWLWERAGEDALEQFAVALTAEAQRATASRGRGAELAVDGEALELLAPSAPGRNASVSIADVLTSGETDRFKLFASLDLPQVMSSSEWPAEEFTNRATEVKKMFDLLSSNATQAEFAVFADGPATDGIMVQRQGQALASMQARALEAIAELDCQGGAGFPDIDADKKPGGAPVFLVACAAVAVIVIVCGLFGRWSWKRWKRYRRHRAAALAAQLLLSECSAPPSNPERVPYPPKHALEEEDPNRILKARKAAAPEEVLDSSSSCSFNARLPGSTSAV